jgi:hypothetical protein
VSKRSVTYLNFFNTQKDADSETPTHCQRISFVTDQPSSTQMLGWICWGVCRAEVGVELFLQRVLIFFAVRAMS